MLSSFTYRDQAECLHPPFPSLSPLHPPLLLPPSCTHCAFPSASSVRRQRSLSPLCSRLPVPRGGGARSVIARAIKARPVPAPPLVSDADACRRCGRTFSTFMRKVGPYPSATRRFISSSCRTTRPEGNRNRNHVARAFSRDLGAPMFE